MPPEVSAPPVGLNRAHQTPVGRITFAIFALVALACLDAGGAIAIFLGLCLSLIVLTPLMCLVRFIGYRMRMKTKTRRTIMLIPTLALCGWVFLVTNGFGGYQRYLLRHGMHGRIPSGTKIVTYQGNSGMMGERFTMTIHCDPDSLRQILQFPPFAPIEESIVSDGDTVLYRATDSLRKDASKSIKTTTPRDEWLCFERSDWKALHTGGSPPSRCDVVTDASYQWAYISYGAGN